MKMNMLLVGGLFAASAMSTARTMPVVGVTGGRVQGACDGVTCRYLGLPYAAPPLAEKRWTPPQPVEPWAGVRDATSYASNCLQPGAMLTANLSLAGDEDCLYLNVWTPANKQACEGGCAVMFWIHGGAYVTGGTAPPIGVLYDGAGLVKRAGDAKGEGVIVVTTNYRLSVMGFAGGAELRKRDKSSGSTGNYGIQDQRQALEWVRDNAHAFGGDPARVMIFGESAGGGSVSMHLTMERSWGLFARAAIESGAWSYWSAQPMGEAQAQYDDLKSAAGCADDECLAGVDAHRLMTLATVGLPGRPRPYGCPWAPTADGVELSKLPWALRDDGHVSKVPVLAGFNKDEGTIGINASAVARKAFSMTQADFETYLTADQNVPAAHVARAVALYAPGSGELHDADYTNWYWSLTHLLGDYAFSCPTRRALRALEAAGAPSLYQYYFTRTPRAPPFSFAGITGVTGTAGASHASEIAFVFQASGAGDDHRLQGADERLLSDTVSQYWVNFARSADPNIGGGTNLTERWPPYSTANGERSLQLDYPQLSSAERRLAAQCDFVDSLGVFTPSSHPQLRMAF
eukprot:g766.t1